MPIGGCGMCGNKNVALYFHPKNNFLMVCGNCRLMIQQEVLAEESAKREEKRAREEERAAERREAEESRRYEESRRHGESRTRASEAEDVRASKHISEAGDSEEDAELVSKAKAFNDKGREKVAEGNYTQAADLFAKAIELRPIATHYNNRGFARLWSGNYDGAIADFTKAIALKGTGESGLGEIHRGRALAFKELTFYESAKMDLELALEYGVSEGSAAGEDLAEVLAAMGRS